MFLPQSINALMGVITSLSSGILGIYVKHYYGGSGKVSTIALNLLNFPWTLKFIYGILIDTLIISIQTKLTIVKYLPTLIILTNQIPILFALKKWQYYIFCFFVSVPNSVTQCIISVYFYQQINAKVYNKNVLSNVLYYNYMGGLVGILTIWIVSAVFKDRLNIVITITYITIIVLSLLLMLLTHLLQKDLESIHIKNEEFIEIRTSYEKLKNTFKVLFVFLKDDVVWRLLLFIFICGLIPTYTGYTLMFIIAGTEKNGLGLGVEFNNFLRVSFYLGSAVGPKIYSKIMKLINPRGQRMTREIRRYMTFFLLFVKLFYTFFSEFLYILPKDMDEYVKGTLYAIYSFFGALYLTAWVNVITEIMSDKCIEGLEGCGLSLWTSILNFSPIMSDTLGLWVIDYCRSKLKIGTKGDFITLIPATYISFLVNVLLLMSGYLIH